MTKEFVDTQRIGAYVNGEIPEPLLITIKDANGDAIDLTGYTASIKITAVDQTVAGIGAGTASVDNAAGGITKYVWDAADFTTDALYRLQMWVGNGTNRFGSDVFEYFVRQPVAAAPSV